MNWPVVLISARPAWPARGAAAAWAGYWIPNILMLAFAVIMVARREPMLRGPRETEGPAAPGPSAAFRSAPPRP